ncbi:MAG: ubiquinol-cytochrome C reductase [Fusobacterium sp.]|uniref:ubiquinol-cytochrome C reductase n=1 Tax=Fusobacterium sp. TaxID=68766 RepID=UPI0026DAF601|nr:ubiquinol-cytochrome C reductase [Fusobacterium sp.]MDO4689861.1 ubiquinol-cytochrome C reductase [Fusobacterium sp.]
MKKIIIGFFMLMGVLSFSQGEQRYVERCKVTSVGKYEDGTKYIDCISLQSGKTFNFTQSKQYTEPNYNALKKDKVYLVIFYGKGYKNLSLHDWRELN